MMDELMMVLSTGKVGGPMSNTYEGGEHNGLQKR